MKIQLLEVAKVELDEAIDYYNREAPGLAADFLIEILDALGRIEKYPEAWHPLSNLYKSCERSYSHPLLSPRRSWLTSIDFNCARKASIFIIIL